MAARLIISTALDEEIGMLRAALAIIGSLLFPHELDQYCRSIVARS